MTSTEEAVVSPHDWVLGIAFSVLASIIGGASKLSIRKSWIMDTQRKQGLISMAANTTSGSTCYEDVNKNNPTINNENVGNSNLHIHDGNQHRGGFEHKMNILSPLEVSLTPPPPLSSSNPMSNNHSLQSPSSQDGYHLDNTTTTTTTNRNPKNTLSLHPKTTSWILYLLGMIGMSFLNPLFCVLAMKYANPSILAPFSGLTLVWVVTFSSATLGEHPGWGQRVACGLIVGGEILVAVFGDHTNGEEKSVEDVLSSYQEPAFRAFVVFMTLFLLQLGIFIHVCPKQSLLRKVAWGSIGGSITGFQNFLKDGLTIIRATSRQSQLAGSTATTTTTTASSHLPIFVFFGMATAFLGLLFLASCMKRYDATYSAAMFVVSFILSASLMSAVHYQTLDHLDGWWNVIMYPVGLGTLFLGAFLLVKPGVLEGWWLDGWLGCLGRRLCICGDGDGGGGCRRLLLEKGGVVVREEEEEEDGPSLYSEVSASSGVLCNAAC